MLVSQQIMALALAGTIALALLAPLGPLASNRFHHDEAIYSSWGLDVAAGHDLLLSGSPVDKPPLFFYIQALGFVIFGPTEVAARLPSLIAHVFSVGLTYLLGSRLYGRGTGLVAAFLLAASPFAILFAPTAFTDPLMVSWMLAGCLAAIQGRSVWAGICLGLAAITKQQGIFFVPLALALGHVANPKTRPRSSRILSFAAAFLAVLSLGIGWDMARARQPGFLAQSLISYGELSLSLDTAWQNLRGFCGLLRYGSGSSVLNGAFIVGLPLLLGLDGALLLGRSTAPSPESKDAKRSRQASTDLVLLAFVVLFLVGHSLVAFRVWDRYLLGLMPCLAFLLARITTLPWRWLGKSPSFQLLGVLFVLGMLSFTLRPIQDAAASRFPIGGDHGAYQGIEQVVSYLQTIPADTTLYHRFLGMHWRFYLWGSPYDFRAWNSPADLAAQAVEHPGARRFVVFPSWRSPTEARLALVDAGLIMREVHRSFRNDGSVAFTVYRIEEAP